MYHIAPELLLGLAVIKLCGKNSLCDNWDMDFLQGALHVSAILWTCWDQGRQDIWWETSQEVQLG